MIDKIAEIRARQGWPPDVAADCRVFAALGQEPEIKADAAPCEAFAPRTFGPIGFAVVEHHFLGGWLRYTRVGAKVRVTLAGIPIYSRLGGAWRLF